MNYDWKDFWPFFETLNKDSQQFCLKQLELKPLLTSLSYEQQQEVLKNAPKLIVQSVQDVLKGQEHYKLVVRWR